ncbi:hypothetical protein SAMN04488056_102613 [Cohaesibacter marisflavi]|uniref:Uncharacterized protein n=1 Tax=Cohaesibacter marisflavi TaxID=655353 RepID=A0A1I5DI79_9HYPH|nr:hypothetical protein SAMN04488056_102613 [Cohaesibacter marisflavi]
MNLPFLRFGHSADFSASAKQTLRVLDIRFFKHHATAQSAMSVARLFHVIPSTLLADGVVRHRAPQDAIWRKRRFLDHRRRLAFSFR